MARKGLDGRQREKTGRIDRKHGNTRRHIAQALSRAFRQGPPQGHDAQNLFDALDKRIDEIRKRLAMEYWPVGLTPPSGRTALYELATARPIPIQNRG